MDSENVIFEEEPVRNGICSTLKYFNFKGYRLRAKKRAPISQKSNVFVQNVDDFHGVNESIIKEKYRELARVFHGSKPAKQITSKYSKKSKLSFPISAEEKKKCQENTKPKARLFGFT